MGSADYVVRGVGGWACAGGDPEVVDAADCFGVVGAGGDVGEGGVAGAVKSGEDLVEAGEEGCYLGSGDEVVRGVGVGEVLWSHRVGRCSRPARRRMTMSGCL